MLYPIELGVLKNTDPSLQILVRATRAAAVVLRFRTYRSHSCHRRLLRSRRLPDRSDRTGFYPSDRRALDFNAFGKVSSAPSATRIVRAVRAMCCGDRLQIYLQIVESCQI